MVPTVLRNTGVSCPTKNFGHDYKILFIRFNTIQQLNGRSLLITFLYYLECLLFCFVSISGFLVLLFSLLWKRSIMPMIFIKIPI